MNFKNKLIYSIKNIQKILSYISKKIKLFPIKLHFYINHLLGRKNLVFEITSPGEFWYVEPIWSMLKCHKDLSIFFSVENDGLTELPWAEYIVYLVKNGVAKRKIIDSKKVALIDSADLFLSPTAWTTGIPHGDIPKIQIFHTLGSKSMLELDKLLQFNVLFLTGPEMKNKLTLNFFKKYVEAREIKFFEIGYPKSDALVKKSYDRDEIMRRLSLDPGKPIVIYAPNWEREASLHIMGHEIIKTLAEMEINLLLKLHHSSYRNPKHVHVTGGIDWKKEIQNYCRKYPNVINIFDFNSNPYLFVSDVMITDAGGVGFEYILLNKPIIFIDVPEYFEKYGKDGIDYWGRSAGTIIKKTQEIPEAVLKALSDPMEHSIQRNELIEKMTYNPGNSADKASSIVLQLLNK
jgi:hypothetical protein